MGSQRFVRARPKRGRRRNWKKLIIIVVSVLAVAGLAYVGWKLVHNKLDGTKNDTGQGASQVETTNVNEEKEKPPLIDLQPTVDAWAENQNATYGIVVYDLDNEQVVASRGADEKFFAASLYKLFVAYLALEDFQSGKQSPDTKIVGEQTKKQCVDKMIRESDSPCGEAMMAAMGQKELKDRLEVMGIQNTKFSGIETTAADCALILQYMVQGRDLLPKNIAFLRDAMTVQDTKFRRGLAAGAPEAQWATKVGWNESYNYHDVGIMTLPNGREYVVAILGQGNGSPTPIANFAKTIYSALK